MLTKQIDIRSVPFRGGAVTSVQKALIPFGGYSWIQNIRGNWPEFIKRPGQSKLHTTADGTNSVMSLYQFNKSRVSENHLFAQFSDSDILEATTDPPGITTGAFGSEVFSGSASPWPGKWSDLSDYLLFSNGVDQHQIYGGNSSFVDKFIKYDGAAAPPAVPELGFDYSVEVSDGQSGTVAVLDSLDTYANNECIFIMTKIPITGLNFTVSAANGNSSTADVYYWNGAWTDANITDGTDSGGATLAQTGSMTWTAPSDEIPKYQYGASGFWYQIRVSAQLDAEVEISAVKFESEFTSLINVWDGVPSYAVEAQVEGTTQYEVYGAASVSLDSLASGKKIMIASTDPIEGIYIDPGETPNATGTALTSLKYWDGDSFETVGTVTDGTSGMSNAGWLTFPRKTDAQPHQFGGSSVYAYWYELIWDSAISADVTVSIEIMPFFDIDEFGPIGQCNCVWKDRGIYNFNLWGAYIYISAAGNPLVLNGTDYGILKAGDGRANKIVAMEKFHNELIVWQEEKGTDGGCITLFEGYSPETFGKLVLSTRLGTMNAKSVAVVDGVMTSTATDETIKTLAFFLSRYGVGVTDGRTVSIISDDISNYFDPNEAECIRRGYEKDMWLAYDSAHNVIRVGLVSGNFCTGTDIAFSDSDPDTITTSGNVNFVTSGIKAGMKITTSSSNNPGPFTVDSVTATTITLISGDSLTDESAGTFTIYPASPNIFPVFDLTDRVWSFDDLGQTLGCMIEAEALSGDVPTVQIGGGIGDGFVYRLNNGTDDVSTAIDAYATMELDIRGQYFNLRRLMLRMRAQSSGDATITITQNDLSNATLTKSMIAERTGQGIRRHLIPLNVTDQHISIKFQNNGSGESLGLLDLGFDISVWQNR